MAREIDIQTVIEEIKSSLDILDISSYSEYSKGFDDGLEYVLDLIEKAPTLTQPNEHLTCDGCISLGTSYGPCMNCIRSRLRGDMYRRPPEGEGNA